MAAAHAAGQRTVDGRPAEQRFRCGGDLDSSARLYRIGHRRRRDADRGVAAGRRFTARFCAASFRYSAFALCGLVLWVGPDMEAFLNKALVPISATRKLAISELPAVKPLLMKGEDDDDHEHAGEAHNHADDDHGHHHGEYNMHVWLSPEIAKVTAIAIHDRLLELMPQNKDKLDANLRQFENLLAQTDKNVGNMLTPVQGKGYFVFHDAYGYFEKHYGLSPLGHFTVNPEIQHGAQRLHQIRTQLVEQKAVCVLLSHNSGRP